VEWWNDLWRSPQATRYTTMHKHRAYLALYALHLFYRNPTERLMQRVEVALDGLGVKEADLRRLQWEAPTAPPPEPKEDRKPRPTIPAPTRRRDPRLQLVEKPKRRTA
jgi:hypothetical protein